MDKSGSFLCSNAPDPTVQIWDWKWQTVRNPPDGITCRQDVSITEEEPDKARHSYSVAVLYRRNKERWDFLRLVARPGLQDH
jgi:hypothetical protein